MRDCACGVGGWRQNSSSSSLGKLPREIMQPLLPYPISLLLCMYVQYAYNTLGVPAHAPHPTQSSGSVKSLAKSVSEVSLKGSESKADLSNGGAVNESPRTVTGACVFENITSRTCQHSVRGCVCLLGGGGGGCQIRDNGGVSEAGCTGVCCGCVSVCLLAYTCVLWRTWRGCCV